MEQVEYLINMHEVKKLTGLCATTIYKLVNEQSFPMYVKVGRSTRWALSEVKEWVNNKLAQREVMPEDHKEVA